MIIYNIASERLDKHTNVDIDGDNVIPAKEPHIADGVTLESVNAGSRVRVLINARKELYSLEERLDTKYEITYDAEHYQIYKDGINAHLKGIDSELGILGEMIDNGVGIITHDPANYHRLSTEPPWRVDTHLRGIDNALGNLVNNLQIAQENAPPTHWPVSYTVYDATKIDEHLREIDSALHNLQVEGSGQNIPFNHFPISYTVYDYTSIQEHIASIDTKLSCTVNLSYTPTAYNASATSDMKGVWHEYGSLVSHFNGIDNKLYDIGIDQSQQDTKITELDLELATTKGKMAELEKKVTELVDKLKTAIKIVEQDITKDTVLEDDFDDFMVPFS